MPWLVVFLFLRNSDGFLGVGSGLHEKWKARPSLHVHSTLDGMLVVWSHERIDLPRSLGKSLLRASLVQVRDIPPPKQVLPTWALSILAAADRVVRTWIPSSDFLVCVSHSSLPRTFV